MRYVLKLMVGGDYMRLRGFGSGAVLPPQWREDKWSDGERRAGRSVVGHTFAGTFILVREEEHVA